MNELREEKVMKLALTMLEQLARTMTIVLSDSQVLEETRKDPKLLENIVNINQKVSDILYSLDMYLQHQEINENMIKDQQNLLRQRDEIIKFKSILSEVITG
jgi:hypothetical protein